MYHSYNYIIGMSFCKFMFSMYKSFSFEVACSRCTRYIVDIGPQKKSFLL